MTISQDNTAHRTWNVPQGIYKTLDNGASSDWFIVAQNIAEWGPDFKPTFTVLAHYTSEDLTDALAEAEEHDNFYECLQDQAIALANQQKLVPENTVLLILSNAFYSSVIGGWGKE